MKRNAPQSKIVESLRSDLATLLRAGAISKETMRHFDAVSPSRKRSGATDVKASRKGSKRHGS